MTRYKFAAKKPTYNPREMLAINSADRVIARLFVRGEWKEQEFFPNTGQTVANKLAEVQHALRHHIDPNAGVVLYVGCVVNSERLIAAMPLDSIPDELKR